MHKKIIFMDLAGSLLKVDPHEKIVRANLTSGPKFDYCAKDLQTGIGWAEIWGLRENQEDRIVVGVFETFKKLTQNAKIKFFQDVLQKLQTEITNNSLKGGSTLCWVMIDYPDIYTISVGDSTAYLILLDKTGKTKKFIRLNRILHNPDEKTESARLNSKFVFGGRLGGSLALSRALGDNQFEKFGLLHAPDEIYLDNIQLQNTEIGFIINACDGLTEGGALQDADIIQIMEENFKNPPEIIATILASTAFSNGSQDNISVIIAPIKAKSRPTYLAIFDGHGGDDVSEYLFNNFAQSMQI